MSNPSIESEKFKSKFRVKSARMPGWDYSQTGYYFVTICTKGMKKYFGDIVEGKVCLSKIGEIARIELVRAEEIRDNIVLDKWIIMPNHIHIILFLDNVETHCNASLPINQFGPQQNNLASIIRGFKSSVKRICNKQDLDFSWQSRFYDHIVQNEKSLLKIRNYIENNVAKWLYDDYYL